MDLPSYLQALPLGGRADLAEEIGIAPTYLYQIARGLRPVPVGRCLAIERATGGQVTRYDLRPDVFGPAPGVDPELPAPRPSEEEAA